MNLSDARKWQQEVLGEFVQEDKYCNFYSYDKHFDYMVWERNYIYMVYLIKKGTRPSHNEGLFLTRLKVMPESKEHLEMMLSYKDNAYG